MITESKKATLLLANGMEFTGCSIGKQGTTIGEVVFTTGMAGYQETLTDPSYCGQIVTQTFPLMGNYGVNSIDKQSDSCHLAGYIIREWCELPSNFRCENRLDHYLEEQNVIGIYDVDTRALTKVIRENGVMNGMITTEEIVDKEALLAQISAFKAVDAVKNVSTKKVKTFETPNATNHVALVDFGYKHYIRNELLKRGCNVSVVPYNTTAAELKELNVDGVVLSNGPGDPTEDKAAILQVKEILALNIPTFGISLGHQLIALANGAKVEKLLHGHRGANQPVLSPEHDRTLVTCQNHGYAVIGDTLDANLGVVNYKNANDGSCEGIRYTTKPVFTVQFHPEVSGGPQDTTYLFDEFVKLIGEGK